MRQPKVFIQMQMLLPKGWVVADKTPEMEKSLTRPPKSPTIFPDTSWGLLSLDCQNQEVWGMLIGA